MKRVVTVGMVMLAGATALVGCGSRTDAPPPTAAAPISATTTTTAIANPVTIPAPAGEFCAQLKQIQAIDTAGVPAPEAIDQFIVLLKNTADIGPAEAKDALKTIADTFTRVQAIMAKPNDPNAQAEAIAIYQDPKLATATKTVQDVAKSKCNLDIVLSGDSSTQNPPDNVNVGPSLPPDNGGAPTGATVTVESVQKYVKSKGDPAWAAVITDSGSWQYSGQDEAADWEIQLTDTGSGTPTLSTANALAACKVIGDYLTPFQPAFSLLIRGVDGKVIVSKPGGGACAAG